jgi:hypothetical protein
MITPDKEGQSNNQYDPDTFKYSHGTFGPKGTETETTKTETTGYINVLDFNFWDRATFTKVSNKKNIAWAFVLAIAVGLLIIANVFTKKQA